MQTYSEYFYAVVSDWSRIVGKDMNGLSVRQKDEQFLSEMCNTLNELTLRERRENLRLLWWFAAAFVECLKDGGITYSEDNIAICRLFSDVINTISQGQSDRSDQKLFDIIEMMKKEICDSRSDGPLLNEVKEILISDQRRIRMSKLQRRTD